QDRGRHHAEADAEEALRRHVVLTLQAVPAALVGVGQLAPAVARRPGDPPEPGVELLVPPRLGLGQLLLLALTAALVEQRDRVRPLAPDELLLRLALGRV